MTNPFHLAVNDIAVGLSEPVDTSGPSPVRWGGSMLAVEENTPVEVHGTLSNLGEAIMVNAQVDGTATGTCARCLQDISTTFDFHINNVFGLTPDFITGDEDEEGETEEPLLVENDIVDITQLVLDEAGLNTPFSPSCADCGIPCRAEAPAPDGQSEGIAGGAGDEEAEEKIDPRWAGLAKFSNLGSEEARNED